MPKYVNKRLITLLTAVLPIALIMSSCGAQKNDVHMSEHKYTNDLIHESSPYLLQHAHNPVNWQAWNEATLAQAKKENKMLIVSVGYAACHWCHVMEHESFEDSLVAEIMNEHFIPIKVDREERPDVDDVYMTACNLVSGRGGWPLNAFAMPDGRPVWAGTYFPKDQWIGVLKQFIELKENNPARLEDSADKLTKGIANRDDIVKTDEKSTLNSDVVAKISQRFLETIDMSRGGRSGAPKFPMPNNYEYLLRYGVMYDDADALAAVTTTLDAMAMGGIYDQIGGGFARYSVDADWHVPHFEKMTYDNGQLLSLYAQAYKHTGSPLYENVIQQTVAYVMREMTSDEHGFYSSLDADSEGEEGKFYVWTKAEIDSLLEPDELDMSYDYFDISEDGNWEHGVNILRRMATDDEIAKMHSMEKTSLDKLKAKWSDTLMQARDRRERPGLDDKILTSWNAIMIKGLVDAYSALQEESYLTQAMNSTEFILENLMDKDYRLNRNYKNGKSSINAFLDDYAMLIDALVAVYQATFDYKYLNTAKGLASYTIDHFYKESNGMFNYTSDVDPPLVARTSELSDNVIPASNSVMARNLHVLGALLYERSFTDISEQMLQNMIATLETTSGPSFYSNWLQLYLEQLHPGYEIAIVGEEYAALRKNMMKKYHPNAIFLGGAEEGELKLLQSKLNDNQTLIYVCQNKSCKFPVDNVIDALALMQKK